MCIALICLNHRARSNIAYIAPISPHSTKPDVQIPIFGSEITIEDYEALREKYGTGVSADGSINRDLMALSQRRIFEQEVLVQAARKRATVGDYKRLKRQWRDAEIVGPRILKWDVPHTTVRFAQLEDGTLERVLWTGVAHREAEKEAKGKPYFAELADCKPQVEMSAFLQSRNVRFVFMLVVDNLRLSRVSASMDGLPLV